MRFAMILTCFQNTICHLFCLQSPAPDTPADIEGESKVWTSSQEIFCFGLLRWYDWSSSFVNSVVLIFDKGIRNISLGRWGLSPIPIATRTGFRVLWYSRYRSNCSAYDQTISRLLFLEFQKKSERNLHSIEKTVFVLSCRRRISGSSEDSIIMWRDLS